MNQEHIVVAGMNEASLSFIRLLMYRKLPFVVLTNNKQEEAQMKKLGVASIVRINTNQRNNGSIPEMIISEVFIFESSLALSCRYLRCCRQWTAKPVYVITQNWNPRAIYKGLGADHVIYSKAGELGFLLHDRETGN